MTENKRDRRRLKREAEFGPERLIMKSTSTHHLLECGHSAEIRDNESPGQHLIKLRRCEQCKEEKW